MLFLSIINNLVLKYWIENQFHDLDARTLERLRVFIATALQVILI